MSLVLAMCDLVLIESLQCFIIYINVREELGKLKEMLPFFVNFFVPIGQSFCW